MGTAGCSARNRRRPRGKRAVECAVTCVEQHSSGEHGAAADVGLTAARCRTHVPLCPPRFPWLTRLVRQVDGRQAAPLGNLPQEVGLHGAHIGGPHAQRGHLLGTAGQWDGQQLRPAGWVAKRVACPAAGAARPAALRVLLASGAIWQRRGSRHRCPMPTAWSCSLRPRLALITLHSSESSGSATSDTRMMRGKGWALRGRATAQQAALHARGDGMPACLPAELAAPGTPASSLPVAPTDGTPASSPRVRPCPAPSPHPSSPSSMLPRLTASTVCLMSGSTALGDLCTLFSSRVPCTEWAG